MNQKDNQKYINKNDDDDFWSELQDISEEINDIIRSNSG